MSVTKQKLKEYMDLLVDGVSDVIQQPSVYAEAVSLHKGLTSAADAVGAEVATCDRAFDDGRYPYKSYFHYAGKEWYQIGETPEASRE